MLKKIQDRRPFFIVLIIFWILFLLIINPFQSRLSADRYFGYEEDELISLSGGSSVSESFTSLQEGFGSLKVLIHTNDIPDKDIRVTFSDGSTQLFQKTLDQAEKSMPGGIYLFPFADSAAKMDTGSYLLEIENLSDDPASEISIPAHTDIADAESAAETTDPDLKGSVCSLNFRAVYQNGSLDLLYALLWILLILSSFVCVFLMNDNPARDFLVLGIAVGFFYVVLHPFPHEIDESTHFFRAFAISEGQFEDTAEADGSIGAMMPVNYPSAVYTGLSITKLYANSEFYRQPFADETVFTANKYMSSYLPFCHLFSALGIRIGTLFHLSIAWVILLGRAFNYLVYLLLCYFAVKTARYYQMIFFAIALFPMCLYVSGSCSQDSVIIGGALFWVSLCLKYIFEPEGPKIGLRELLLFFIPVPFLSSVKYFVYIPLYLLALFISEKRISRKQKLVMIASVTAVTLVMAGYQYHLLKLFNYTEDRVEDVNVGDQIKYVMSDVPRAFSLFFRHVTDSFTAKMTTVTCNIITDISGNQTSVYPFLVIPLSFLVILGAPLADKKYLWENEKKKRIFLTAIFLISFFLWFLIVAAEYVGFNAVASTEINGDESRYFYPFFPLLLILFANIPLENKIKQYSRWYIFLMLLINFSSATAMLFVPAF